MIEEYRLRAATVDDAGAYARLMLELETGDPPPTLPQIRALLPQMEIAEGGGHVLGYTVAAVENGIGFVRQIVVDPAARGRGLGRALFGSAVARLRALGARGVRLNVKEDNHAAIALYAAAGLRPDFRSAALWMTHADRLRLRGSADPLALYAPAPFEDTVIESQFGLQAGRLAHFRNSPSPPLAVRPAGGGPARGVMRFSPDYPGAYPFCALDSAAARALLLEAALSIPTAPRYGVVIERHDRLIDTLVAAGAQLRFRMVQMAGAL